MLANGHRAGLLVRVDDLEGGRAALAAVSIPAVSDGEVLRVVLPSSEAATVTEALASQGLYLTELRPDEADLETVFLALIGEHPMEVAR